MKGNSIFKKEKKIVTFDELGKDDCFFYEDEVTEQFYKDKKTLCFLFTLNDVLDQDAVKSFMNHVNAKHDTSDLFSLILKIKKSSYNDFFKKEGFTLVKEESNFFFIEHVFARGPEEVTKSTNMIYNPKTKRMVKDTPANRKKISNL